MPANKKIMPKSYKKKLIVKPRKSSSKRARISHSSSTAPARLGQEVGDVGMHVSPATEAYLHAITNPADAPPAGIPIGGIPSEKNKCWARGRMSTGVNGTGFIMMLPSGIIANDANCGFCTGPLFAGTVLTNTQVVNNVVAIKGNSPYTLAQFGITTLKARFVAGEVRIRYVGTENNRGGDAVVVCDANHNSLLGLSEANLLGFPSAGRSDIEMREWISCKYNGVVDPSEENYVTDPISSLQTKNSVNLMAIWVNSAVAAQPFDYEIWGHFEVIGALGAAQTTTSPDPVGHTAVNSGSQLAQIEHPGSHEEPDYMHKLMGKVFHTITTGVTKVGDILSDKGTQQVITGALQKYAPKVMGNVAKFAPLLLL